jgi:hypothetical protein
MLIISELSKELLIEITNITMYFANRSSINIIFSGKILHELFYGSKFIYKYLRIFAYAAYALDHQIKKISKMALILEKY